MVDKTKIYFYDIVTSKQVHMQVILDEEKENNRNHLNTSSLKVPMDINSKIKKLMS